MKIALCSDAWFPQINGVVTTWTRTGKILQREGHQLEVVHPGIGPTFACPRYPQIRLAFRPYKRVAKLLEKIEPDAVHIATEGPVGRAARRWCIKNSFPFSSSYHTQFPIYLKEYAAVPETLTYSFLRRFHGAATTTLVPTESLKQILIGRGFKNLVTWTRGVDTEKFKPIKKRERKFSALPRPVFLYCGRVAREKNLDAFLKLDLPGSKVIVGDGPDRKRLSRLYDKVYWCGFREGEDLAKHVASGDVFVFPSKSDTFGVVMLEAMACGLPVAAFPETGPIDVVKPGKTGYVDRNLRKAALAALDLDPAVCRSYAEEFTWQKTAEIFLANLALQNGLKSASAVKFNPGDGFIPAPSSLSVGMG